MWWSQEGQLVFCRMLTEPRVLAPRLDLKKGLGRALNNYKNWQSTEIVIVFLSTAPCKFAGEKFPGKHYLGKFWEKNSLGKIPWEIPWGKYSLGKVFPGKHSLENNPLDNSLMLAQASRSVGFRNSA